MSEWSASDEVWARLEAAMVARDPGLLEWLGPPADESALQRIEKEVGQRLPEEVRYAYLRHDGQRSSLGHDLAPPYRLPLFFSYWWMPLDEVLSDWKMQVKIADDQHDDWVANWEDPYLEGRVVIQLAWFRGWVPIGRDESRGRCFVDLVPGKTGSHGQLVSYLDVDPPEDNDVFATGLNDYLWRLADCLETGKIRGAHDRYGERVETYNFNDVWQGKLI